MKELHKALFLAIRYAEQVMPDGYNLIIVYTSSETFPEGGSSVTRLEIEEQIELLTHLLNKRKEDLKNLQNG